MSSLPSGMTRSIKLARINPAVESANISVLDLRWGLGPHAPGLSFTGDTYDT